MNSYSCSQSNGARFAATVLVWSVCLLSPNSPVCSADVDAQDINRHLDSGCSEGPKVPATPNSSMSEGRKKASFAPIFSQAKAKRAAPLQTSDDADDIEIIDQTTRPGHASSKSKSRPEASSASASGSNVKGDEPPPAKRLKTTTANLRAAAPLAERMRPAALDDVVGHEHITAKDSLLRGLIENGGTGSMILVSNLRVQKRHLH